MESHVFTIHVKVNVNRSSNDVELAFVFLFRQTTSLGQYVPHPYSISLLSAYDSESAAVLIDISQLILVVVQPRALIIRLLASNISVSLSRSHHVSKSDNITTLHANNIHVMGVSRHRGVGINSGLENDK